MAKCALCDKVGRSGHNVSHSKRRTKTRFKPNMQRSKMMVGGQMRRVTLCTRCLRTNSKMPRVA